MNIGFRENMTAEFKSDLKKLSDDVIIESVVAFANTDGGKFFLGVEDNGDITGLHPSHKDPSKLAAFIANKTIPPVAVQTELMDADDVKYLIVTVPKYTAIVAASNGKVLRRRIKLDGEPENIPMYPVVAIISIALIDVRKSFIRDSIRECSALPSIRRALSAYEIFTSEALVHSNHVIPAFFKYSAAITIQVICC